MRALRYRSTSASPQQLVQSLIIRTYLAANDATWRCIYRSFIGISGSHNKADFARAVLRVLPSRYMTYKLMRSW